MSLSDRIKPISYLKAHAAEIIRTLADQPEPLIVTQNGEAKAVVQDIDSYEQMLKGAMLFALWNESFHRQTQDIDFAAYGSSETDDVVPALQHVCRIAVDDGVAFDADHMTTAPIRGATDKGGIRVRFPATVDRARVTVQVDVGFGDSIQPPPADAQFPPLLETATSCVLAYPKEAVVSEKFRATIEHGEQTSRYKDFFDLYLMARRFPFDGARLMQALAATFDGRPAPTDDIPLSLTTGFYSDTTRGERWRTYLVLRHE